MRRRARRVVLDCLNHAGGARVGDLGGRRPIRQVERHQRLEPDPVGQGGKNSLAIGFGCDGCCDRRSQVGHDDCSSEYARGRSGDCGEHRPVTQMHVPIVRTDEYEPIG